MKRSRLTAAALLGISACIFACTSKQENGQECLKSVDCESERCVQYVCVDPAASRADQTADGGATGETGGEEVGVDTGMVDTGAADTGPADTGTADTGTADTGTADTGAADAGGD